MARSTFRIDDDLMSELQRRAGEEGISLTLLVNRVLRQGLAAPGRKRKRFVEQPAALGKPRVDLDKALAVAATLEDEESLRELTTGR